MSFWRFEWSLIILFCCPAAVAQYKVSGLISESKTNERLPYVNVYVETLAVGVSSNAYGFYSFEVPSNQSLEITYSSIGYRAVSLIVSLYRDTVLNVTMEPLTLQLSEVVVSYPTNESQNQDNGHVQLDLAEAQRTPTMLGEKDLLKTLQFLPGVQRGSEGSVALYVRGGSPDQNLLILDEATVYNANHLFGFFSVFNGDAIKRLDFWKGSLPARYGGRISSVIDMQMKEGGDEKISGKGGVGLLSSRLTLEGPLVGKKSTFLVSARRSYLDLLITPFMSESARSSYVLQDFNIKVTNILSQKDRLIVSGYFGSDKLKTSAKESSVQARTNLGWGNATLSTRWNRLISKSVFLNTTLLYTGFDFKLINDVKSDNLQSRNDVTINASSIRDLSLKSDIDIFANNKHSLKGGVVVTNHFYRPRIVRQENFTTGESVDTLRRYVTQEVGIYVEDSWRPSDRIRLDYGLRISGLNASGRIYKFLEPRASVSYELPSNVTISGSYSRSNQFVHLLSNTGMGLSTDLWVPVTNEAPPQQSDQFSAGISKHFIKKGVFINVETYRKLMRNIIAYTEGATFLSISENQASFNWEKNITTGKGTSYGTEILLEKRTGALRGWIGYTLAWVVHSFDELNNGKTFFPKYDSRHNISAHLSYQFSEKLSASVAWLYSSPSVFSAPHAFYPTNTTIFSQPFFVTTEVPYFGSQNSFRGEAFHRLDLAIKLYKKKKRFARSWEFGLYNAYNRKNPLYYYLDYRFDVDKAKYVADLNKRSLFPIIPSITYNFEF